MNITIYFINKTYRLMTRTLRYLYVVRSSFNTLSFETYRQEQIVS
jgi:hypothetical protein